MIGWSSKGNLDQTEAWLKKLKNPTRIKSILSKYGEAGVNALAAATPKDTGETSISWTYEVATTSRGFEVNWTNTNVNQGVNIALILQVGHGQPNGGFVRGRDYINPAMRPIFDNMARDILKEVG